MDAGAFGLLVTGGDRVLCGSDCKWRECGVTGRLYAACSKRTARRSKKRKRFCVRKRIAPEYGRGRHRLDRAWTSRTYASEVERPTYYSGMINFIAKYAAKTSPQYPVASATVTGQGPGDAGGTNVDSRITLRSGDGYDVAGSW